MGIPAARPCQLCSCRPITSVCHAPESCGIAPHQLLLVIDCCRKRFIWGKRLLTSCYCRCHLPPAWKRFFAQQIGKRTASPQGMGIYLAGISRAPTDDGGVGENSAGVLLPRGHLRGLDPPEAHRGGRHLPRLVPDGVRVALAKLPEGVGTPAEDAPRLRQRARMAVSRRHLSHGEGHI
eukprot:1184032-Prorocentrum_minimum.AAC.5